MHQQEEATVVLVFATVHYCLSLHDMSNNQVAIMMAQHWLFTQAHALLALLDEVHDSAPTQCKQNSYCKQHGHLLKCCFAPKAHQAVHPQRDEPPAEHV